MLAVSQNFKDAIESETRIIKARIVIKGVTYTNSDIFHVEYNGGSITGETFNIGSTFSNNIKITFSSIIEGLLLDDQIKLEFGVVLADSTIEYVKMGTFFITSYDPQRNDYKTVIEASDKMIQLNSIYKSKLTYPARIKDVAIEIANLAGVQVNTTSFARINTSLISQLQGCTFRQAIGLIAQFECGYALFDRNGLLDIRMLSDPEYAVNPSSYFSKGLTKNEVKYIIGGISCKVVQKKDDSSETIILQSGSTSGAQISLENNVMTQTLLDAMYQKIRNVNYFPFTLNWRGNPALEVGDWITVVDLKGTRLKVPNLDYKLSFSGGLKAVSSANTQTVSSSSYQYKGPLKQQLDELSGRIGASGNHVYDGNSEPLSPKEGDLWFKPNGPDTEIWKYQDGKWAFQISTAVNPEIQKSVDQAKQDASNAVTSANDAVNKANANVKDIEDANIKIADLNTLANQAKSDAMTAKDNATMATTKAQTALDKANGVSNKVTTIETDINTINGTLSSKANATDVDAIKKRVTTAETNITQNANGIQLKASKSDVDTISNKVTSVESSLKVQSGQITALNTKADGQTTQISKLESSYDSLSSTISGTVTGITNNSLISTQMIKDTTLKHPNFSDMPMVEIPVTNGETYTVTSNQPWEANAAHVFYTRVTNTNPVSSINGVYDGKSITLPALSDKIYIVFRNQRFADRFINGQYWVKVEVTPVSQIQVSQLTQDLNGFKTTVANTYADKNSVASQINQSATAITSNVQSWTNNRLTAYSTTQQTTSSITTAVADKADKSQVTQLSDQIISTVTGSTNNSLISAQMIKDTTLKHPNFSDMPMVEIPVTNGETYTVTTNQPWEANAAHVFYIRVTNTNPVSSINGVYDGKSITLPALSDKIYIVFRNQRFADRFINGQYWVKVETTSASRSQITQLSSDINLRVSKGDVTSQINIEAGRTLIDTKQLLLSADTVKFTGSAFIPDAMIKSLTADKITAGTINAANINVINLNASNMSTGTINGSNLSMNLNNGEVSFQKGRLFSEKMEINITYGSIIQKQQFGVLELNEGTYRYKNNDGGQTKMSPFGKNNWIGFGFEASRTDGGSGTNYMSLSDNFYVDAESIFKKKVFVNNDLSFDSLTSSYSGFRVKARDTYISSLTLETNSITVDTQYDSLEILDKRSSSSYYKSVSAKAFNTKSLKELKTDIHKLDFNAIDEIEKTDIVSFRYINDHKKKTTGAIIGDGYNISQNILSADKTSVDLYSMVSIAWDAIKQQQKQLNYLKKQL